MNFLDWAQATPVGEWVRSSDSGYYQLLAVHAIGMGVVVGVIFMLGARVLGFSKEEPLLQFQRLFAIAWGGFAINLASGIALFMANGTHLIKNPPFLIKISCIVLGGFSLWALWRSLMAEREVVIDQNGAASMRSKALAVLTIALWLMSIMSGRIIGYTIDY